MTIHRENYPLYFLDYHEGRLSEEGREELMRFLEAHPDLRDEFADFELVRLERDPQLAFPGKDRLKRQSGEKQLPREHNAQQPAEEAGEPAFGGELFYREGTGVLQVDPDQAEWALVALAEGDLDAEEATAVEAYLDAHPAARRDLELLRVARLDPEPGIAYPRKAALKHFVLGSFVRRWSQVAAASAAAVLMAFVLWQFVPDRFPVDYTQDTPADPGRERTEAVAEVPGLQQRTPRAMTPRSPQLLHTGTRPDIHQGTTARRQASLHETGEPGRDLDRSADPEWLPATASVRPLLTARMDRMAPRTAGDVRQMQRAAPDKRQEYYWLAYRDRTTWLAEDPDPAPAAADLGQVSLASFARQEVEERTGIELAQAEEVLHTDVSLLGRYARRGLGSINNLLGQPVVVDGETQADGRTVTFAIGDFFEVSRK